MPDHVVALLGTLKRPSSGIPPSEAELGLDKPDEGQTDFQFSGYEIVGASLQLRATHVRLSQLGIGNRDSKTGSCVSNQTCRGLASACESSARRKNLLSCKAYLYKWGLAAVRVSSAGMSPVEA